MRKLLVQAYERFGDNICSAGAISQIKNAEIYVCTSHVFGDAVLNIPNVKQVLYLGEDEARNFAEKNGLEKIQLTISKMPSYVERLDERCVYKLKEHGFDYIVPNCSFFPTQEETDWANQYASSSDKPLLGFETNYTCSQSFIHTELIDRIVNKFKDKYKIVWLCNGAYPTDTSLIDMPNVPRRHLCALLPKLSLFLSTVSGYFWASKGQGKNNIPRTIAFCLDHIVNWAESTNTTFVLRRDFEAWMQNYND
jgi:hypothetical protein